MNVQTCIYQYAGVCVHTRTVRFLRVQKIEQKGLEQVEPVILCILLTEPTATLSEFYLRQSVFEYK